MTVSEDPGKHGQDDVPDAPGTDPYADPLADPYAGFDGSTAGGGAGGDGGLSTRGVLIAAAVVGVVLVGAVVLAIGLSAGGPETPEARATSTTSGAAPTRSEAVPPDPATSAPAPSLSAMASARGMTPVPVERWRGALTVNGARARRDLDAAPPRTDERRADVRSDWLKAVLKAVGDARVAVFEDGGRPGAVACLDAASAAGGAETEILTEGDAVCVLTGERRVARLIVTHATQTSTAPELTFDAVVWDVAGAGQ